MMKNANAKLTVTAGFLAILALSVASSLFSLSRISSIKHNVEDIANSHNVKTAIINRMQRIIRDRRLDMYAIANSNDPFERDALYVHYLSLAGEFVAQRLQLQTMNMNDNETILLNHALDLIRQVQPVQEGIVNEVMENRAKNIHQKIMAQDYPLEEAISTLFSQIVKLQQETVDNALKHAKQDHAQTLVAMLILNGIAIILGFSIAIAVVRKTSSIEKELSLEKEKAIVTLNAICDGVISVDPTGHINYMSPVAEQITGWSSDEASHRPATDVLNLHDEATKEALNLFSLASQSNKESAKIDHLAILTDKNGNEISVSGTASPIIDQSSDVIGTVIVLRDVTLSRKLANQLSWQATHDALTHLANRTQFEKDAKDALHDAKSNDAEHALLYIDLDQFKVVNDTCGHKAGDELLIQLSTLVSQEIRSTDTLARLGGDEFGLLLHNCPLEKAERIANNVLRVIQTFRFVWESKIFKVGASIGAVAINKTSANVSQILSDADAACYVAKDKGRNRVWVHSSKTSDVAQHRGEMAVTTRINLALEKDLFVLYKQAIVDINHVDKKPTMYEVLVRMLDDKGELVLPMSFIPAAERYGIMPKIDRWIFTNVLDALTKRAKELDHIRQFTINLSALSICDDKFLDYVIYKLDESQLDPEKICFEITETAAISNLSRAIRFMSVLRGMGCKFALDDFGSGMSSFNYLRNLPLDYIKIDGTFVRDISENEINYVMVEATHKIAQVMNIKTIAEFVENKSILHQLKMIGINYAQGNDLHRPDVL